jgi:conserved oligomeric Golgi complex subunit 3
LARYNALLTKALHLLDHGFTTRLEKISSDIGRQVGANHSESARHALAYGRFEELIMDTYYLIPNIQKIVRRAFDQYGRPVEKPSDITPTYANTVSNVFRTWFTTRDRDLKPMTQRDVEEFQKEVKSLSVETACRNFIKQSFERVYNEDDLFLKVFHIEPVWSTNADSVFQNLKTINTSMAHPGHLGPLATNLQSTLQGKELQTICNVVGWLASEYSLSDNEEEESPFQSKSREYAARLLVEHLWPFTDSAFDAEISKSISKAVVQDSSLKIGPVEGGVASSNAFPLVKRAIQLLVMFDQAMPKDRSVSQEWNSNEILQSLT